MWKTEAPPLTTEGGCDTTWFSEDDVTEGSTTASQLAIFTTAGLSFVLNGFVLGVMMTSRRLRRKLSVMFLVHQCACDCFSAASIITFHVVDKMYGDAVGLLGLLYCKILWSEFIVYGSLNAGVFNT
ncbi:hypothetical protein CAPTEDRAFT_203834, partial [Capitella teleta]